MHKYNLRTVREHQTILLRGKGDHCSVMENKTKYTETTLKWVSLSTATPPAGSRRAVVLKLISLHY